jgi:hypothetical protein
MMLISILFCLTETNQGLREEKSTLRGKVSEAPGEMKC